MTKKQATEFWIHFAAGTTPATTPINDKFWNFFSPGDNILEVGVAWGRIVFECLKRNLRVTGIDINPTEISNLQKIIQKQKLFDKVSLHLESVTQMHFPANTFEGIFCKGFYLLYLQKND